MLWWENSFLKVKDGRLHLGERLAGNIAEEHGTPLFVYSREQVRQNIKALKEVFAPSSLCETQIFYAMKANFNTDLLKTLKAEGTWIDAVSPGEVEKALEIGFAGDEILFTGTSVSTSDLERVFSHTGVIVNIDAEEQLELMREVKDTAYKNKEIPVMIRWNPGIGSGFSPKTITAGRMTPDGTPIKFGVEEKRVIPTLEKALSFGFIPIGLHQHLGSGWTNKDFNDVKIAVGKMIQQASRLIELGLQLRILDFGGGFGPRYSESQDMFPLIAYAEYIFEQLAQSELPIKTLAVEPGKYLVGDAGVLLLRVEYIKKSYGNIFACVNGGTFNTIPRPAIYTQAHHHIVNCRKPHSESMVRVTVPGNLCETGDVFRKEVLMTMPERGDVLALLCAGAYCRSMASTFNLRDIPLEIVI